jgi:small GTP-binding protein
MEGSDRIEYKVILLGNSGVGKTSLFKKIMTGEFSAKNISTIGMDKRTISIDADVEEKDKGTVTTKPFDISLVDTAGQERFKSITKTYYKESDGILLLYDVTNKESFTNVTNWISSIYETLGNHENNKYVIFLIGNKIDLIGVNGCKRCVETNEAIEMCKENNMIWGGECSVKINTEEDLKGMIKTYIKHIYSKVGAKEVKNQVVKAVYEKKKKRRSCMGFIQY